METEAVMMTTAQYGKGGGCDVRFKQIAGDVWVFGSQCQEW
jgi:hypothetical protein